jgi:tRNA-2-methylthio-N6-dimethylallyladenosine synthase
MNVSDSERVVSKLYSIGYEISLTSEAADVILFNTCSVREKAEQKVFRRINEIQKLRAHKLPVFGVMGCVAQLEGESIFAKAPSVKLVLGTRALDRLPRLLEQASNNEGPFIDLGERLNDEPENISPFARHSKHVAFLPIIEGCNKFCTYCIVPYSRGRERSRPAVEIVSEVKRLLQGGFQEIHLIGQNVNSYRPKTETGLENFTGATPFSRLLRAVASTGMPRIKFTTSFPRDFHADIVSAIDENSNLCNWVHLPVQSGSDRVLGAMRRGHKISDYLKHVFAIKNARRRISMTSDVIVGFPNETAEDFEQTMRLVEQCQYDGLYIFKYSVRNGTPAAKFKDNVSPTKKTERFLALERLQVGIQQKLFGDYIGTEVEVLAEGISARSVDDLTGHTTCHKVVNFRAHQGLLGKILKVRVTAAKTHGLYGEVIE